jgi:L-fuconolactonase
VNRRSFVAASGATAATAAWPDALQAAAMPIIDTHIHLFDTTRKEGVPWPEKTNKTLFQPAMPDRYRKITGPLGVVGAIKVEASPWVSDNQWVLDVAAKDKIIVGVIGNLEPGKPEFAKQLEGLHKNPLYLGIRYGNLWGRNLADELDKPEFRAGIKLLEQANLTLDSANPTPSLIHALLRLSDIAPKLRIVIDHLPQMPTPTDAAVLKSYQGHLQEFAKRPQVFVKLSEVFRKVNGDIPRDIGAYRATLDSLYGVFGEDRVLYGSDWPNSDNWLPYPEVLGLVQKYFQSKTPAQAEKYFWKNSVKAYRWVKRDATQPGA